MKLKIAQENAEERKNYPYQLTIWLPTRKDLKFAESQFIQYKCCDDAIIVKSSAGFAIFTTGKNRSRVLYEKKPEK